MLKRRFSHYRRRFSLAVLVSPRNVSDCATSVPLFDLVVDSNIRHGLSCMQIVACMPSSRFYSCWSTWWAQHSRLQLTWRALILLFFPWVGFQSVGFLRRLLESVYTQRTHLSLSLLVFWGEVSNISLVSFPSSNWLPHGESEGGLVIPAFCWAKHHLEGKWGSLPGYALCIRTVHLRSFGDWDVADLPETCLYLGIWFVSLFLELHVLTSFLSSDWSGDSLLVFGSAVSNKARHPRPDSDGCP